MCSKGTNVCHVWNCKSRSFSSWKFPPEGYLISGLHRSPVSCVIGSSALLSMDTLAAAMLIPMCDYNITHLKKQEGQMNNLTLFCCGFYHNKKSSILLCILIEFSAGVSCWKYATMISRTGDFCNSLVIFSPVSNCIVLMSEQVLWQLENSCIILGIHRSSG